MCVIKFELWKKRLSQMLQTNLFSLASTFSPSLASSANSFALTAALEANFSAVFGFEAFLVLSFVAFEEVSSLSLSGGASEGPEEAETFEVALCESLENEGTEGVLRMLAKVN